jgi:hypothetical protein
MGALVFGLSWGPCSHGVTAFRKSPPISGRCRLPSRIPRWVNESPGGGGADAPATRALRERWTAEAIRVYRRYQVEIVEDCGLCPWAEGARREGRVRERVLLHVDEPIDPAVLAVEELARVDRVEVGLLIFPRMALGRSDFEHFVSRVREADVRRHALGEVPFMFAAFHPDAAPDVTLAERLIPFLRRTPDPSIQLVRGTALERVRARSPQGTQFVDIRAFAGDVEYTPPLRERIARANLSTTLSMGVEELRRRLDAILRDRDETYASLARDEAKGGVHASHENC